MPGGFPKLDEDIADAAYRELAEDCGVGRGDVVLEQLRTYCAPRRDPRMRVVSVAWLALGADLPSRGPAATQRARGGRRWTRRWCRGWRSTTPRSCATWWSGPGPGWSTPLATAFCAPEFTVGELRAVYEAVWGQGLDPRNFHRKVTSAQDFLVETGERTTRGGGRPARLYVAGPARQLHPPVLRRD